MIQCGKVVAACRNNGSGRLPHDSRHCGAWQAWRPWSSLGSNRMNSGQTSSRGCLRWIFGIGAAIFLVIGCIPGILWYRSWQQSAQEVDAELQRIREAGEPLAANEVDALYSLPQNVDDVTSLWLSAAAPFSTREFKKEVEKIPLLGPLAPEEPLPQPNQPWGQYDVVKQLLDKYETSMKRLHQAAEAGGAARFPTDFSAGPLQKVTFLDGLRQAANMLRLEAVARAHVGDAHGAAQDIQTLMTMSESLTDYPALIPQIVRIAIAGIAYQTIQDLLPYVEFSDDDLVALQKTIQRHGSHDGLYRAMLGERMVGLMAINDPSLIMNKKNEEQRRALRSWSSAWRNSDRAFFLRQSKTLLFAAQQPWPENLQTARQVAKEIDQLGEDGWYAHMKYMMSLLLLLPADVVFEAHGRAQAASNATQTAVAIERFRRERSQLPANLQQLVPDYLSNVLMDPFDGQPLRYIVEGDRYRVYSIGRKGIDDGGKGDLRDNPDIVFSVPPPNYSDE